MAVDETLMHYVRSSGELVLRVYTWDTATLSFGRNQTARGRYDLTRIHDAGAQCVRRPTGGRAVLHFREVTYAVVALEAGLGTLRESYARINQMLLRAMELLGVSATVAAGGVSGGELRTTAHGTSPCFDQPSRGELVVSGRKLVGSAQWRERGVLLQHGSILTSDDQSRITGFLATPTPSGTSPATLSESLGREPHWNEVANALCAALVELEDEGAAELGIGDLPSDELQRAHARYLDPTWTWRR